MRGGQTTPLCGSRRMGLFPPQWRSPFSPVCERFVVKIKRIYEPPSRSDGKRVYVDRLWPRGLRKEQAHFDEWIRDISPSDELRKWFGHDPSKWQEFRSRYKAEMKTRKDFIEKLRDYSEKGTVTLLYSAKDEEHNNALVIKEVIEGKR